MTVAYEIQLEGLMKFAPVTAGVAGAYVDYSSELASLVIGRSRNTVDRKPTYADARTIKRAADLTEQLTVNWLSDETNATGFWSVVWTALGTPPCDMAFQATYKLGALSATNPGFYGFVTVVDIETGSAAGDSNWKSKTWPAYGIAKTITTFP